MQILTFPKGFVWGTATAAHQIEGNNTKSDWWAWENRDRSKETKEKAKWPLEKSGSACDSYNRYEEDFNLCAQANNNAVRISVEWARLEPVEGQYEQAEFEHYKKVLQSARAKGLKTFVTLQHFTLPRWLAKRKGWLYSRVPHYFGRYAQKCAREFGDLVDVYLTINEPQVYTYVTYILGKWPPQEKNWVKAFFAQINLMRAHNNAYKEIKKVANYKVGIVKNIMWYRVSAKSRVPWLDAIYCKIAFWSVTDFFLLPIKNQLDVIGLNYYFTNDIKHFRHSDPQDKLSDLGWWLLPAGIENILIYLKKFKVPIYITENGIADKEDKLRMWWIREVLKHSYNAIGQGVDLRGYFYWSLIDNYEWAEGFCHKFGLVNIDRQNKLKRIPRKSFYEYAKICKDNYVEI